MDPNELRFIEELFVKQRTDFELFVGAALDRSAHDIALVAEGHQTLLARIETLSDGQQMLFEGQQKLTDIVQILSDEQKKLSGGLTALTLEVKALTEGQRGLLTGQNRLEADLAAHRSDTEAHHGMYCVKES